MRPHELIVSLDSHQALLAVSSTCERARAKGQLPKSQFTGHFKNASMSVIIKETRMGRQTKDQGPVKSPRIGVKAARRASSTRCPMSAKTSEGDT